MDALTVFAEMDAGDRARPALIADGVTWSFQDLAGAAASLAFRFKERGITASSRVALSASPSPESFLAIHTLAALGATLVPVHPRLSPAEARVAIDVARADHVLEGADLALPSEHRDPPSIEPFAATAPFAIVSTSGTTGRPKGAVLSRRAFIASADASARNLGWWPDDRWLLCMPLAHVGGLSIVTRCLVARRAVVLLPRFDPAQVLAAIRRHCVTLLSVVPTMLHALLDADAHDTLRLPRALLLGGAAAAPALLDECARRGIRALTTYGLTEACSQVTAQAPRDPSLRLAGSGAALAGFELRIARDDGAPLPPHHAGRILVRGPALFDGYLLDDGVSIDPARTPDTHSAARAPAAMRAPGRAPSRSGFFDSGDLGELDALGQLHVHVRRTDLIVSGGENVYPAEVEQLIESCPGARRALVFGVPDERWGHVVAAAVEVDSRSPPLLPDRLAELFSNRLAPHKRPRLLTFVAQLPLTASGKVERKDALSRFRDSLSPCH
jgi:O-succinylbenzoic acid--CoA ligase